MQGHPNMYPSNLSLGPPNIPGPLMIPQGIQGPAMVPIHTPVGTMGSIGSTPMDVMPSNPIVGGMQEESIAIPQPTPELVEDLRVKYKLEIERLEEILANRFSVDSDCSLIAAGLGATIIFPTPPLPLEEFERTLIEFFQTQVNTKPHSGPILLQDFLTFITKQRGQQRVNYLFGLLITMITKHGILNFSMVCQSVLQIFSLQLPLFIQEGLKFVHKLLPTLDYHACREVITQLLIFLERCPTLIASPIDSGNGDRQGGAEIPVRTSLSRRDLQLLHSVRELLGYMLDRKSALLPAYLALDEIELRYPYKSGKYSNEKPHWVIADLLTQFRDSFSGVARLMTMPISHKLLPAVGISHLGGITWQLDEDLTLCPKVPKDTPRKVRQILPYPPEATKKRLDLLVHIASQLISSEPLLPQIYGLPRIIMRQQNSEQQALYIQSSMALCVEVMVQLMKNCKNGLLDDAERRLWSYQHISGLCLNYWLKIISSYRQPALINSFYYLLYKLIVKEKLKDGRDALMHFFVQSLSFVFRPFLDPLQPADIMLAIFDYLYPDQETLPLPEVDDPLYVYKFSPSYFWIHLYLKMLDHSEMNKTMNVTPFKLSRPMPRVLRLQIEHLKGLSSQQQPASLSCQELIVMSNAHPPHIQSGDLIDTGLKQAQEQLRECLNGRATQPPPNIPLLSCLNLNCKVDTIVKDMVALVHDIHKSDQRPIDLPGQGLIIHTFFSLFHNADLEIAGYKVMTKTPLDVMKKRLYVINTCWLEMVNNRLPVHVTNYFKQQLLAMITQYIKNCAEIRNYMYLLLENTSLKLIMGLAGPDFTHYLNNKQPSHPVEPEFEELNKVFILMLAQTIHTRGVDPGLWEEYLDAAMKACPHFWPSHTLKSFPTPIQEFYDQVQVQRVIGQEEMQILNSQVNEDRMKLLNNNKTEMDIMSYYLLPESHPTLLCLTWCFILEKSIITNAFLKAFISLGQRGLTRHIRSFIDYIVFKLSQEKQNINQYIELLDKLIWTHNLFPLEKIILVMVMKNYEGEQLHTCYRLMQLLLLVPSNFRYSLNLFLNSDNSPSYWSKPEQFNDHLYYHANKPEYFNFEGLKATSGEELAKPPPPFCGNVFTRFLPVFDIVVHRLIEVPPVAAKSLDSLIQKVGPLYKFHYKPFMFLYTTLHYYELNLVNRPALRAKLVSTITRSQENRHPFSWYFTPDFIKYLSSFTEDSVDTLMRDAPQISLQPDYWLNLLQGIKLAVAEPLKSDWTDWRFSEFQSPAAKFLTCISVEILTLPIPPAEVCQNILHVILETSQQTAPGSDNEDDVCRLINAFGLLLVMLPTSYHEVLYAKVLHCLKNLEEIVARQGLAINSTMNHINTNIPVISLSAFSIFTGPSGYIGCIIALVHAFWTHANVGLLYSVHNWLNNKVNPLVETENHLIFILQLIYPLSVRLFIEKRRLFPSLVSIIYNFVKQVDARTENLFYADTICDVLYHIKYVYLGNINKEDIDKTVSSLRPPLQARLRFLTGGDPHSAV